MISQQKVSDDEFLVASYPLLYKLTGKQPNVWTRWFRGYNSPTQDTVQEVARSLGMTPHHFWELMEKRKRINQRLIELEATMDHEQPEGDRTYAEQPKAVCG